MDKQIVSSKDLKKMYNDFISLRIMDITCTIADFEDNIKRPVYNFNAVDEFVESDYLNESNCSVSIRDLVDCFIFDRYLSLTDKRKEKEAAIKIFQEWFLQFHIGTVFPVKPQCMLVLQGPKGIEKEKFLQFLFPKPLTKYVDCSPFENESEDFKLCKNLLRIYTDIDEIHIANRLQLEEHLNSTHLPPMKDSDSLEFEIKRSALCATAERDITLDVPDLKVLYIRITGIRFSKLAKVDIDALYSKFHWSLFVEPQFRADFPGYNQ